MSKISRKMRREVDCLLYFLPERCKWSKPTDDDIEDYFRITAQGKDSKGLHDENRPRKIGESYNGLETLLWGNTWRNRHIYEVYEEAMKEPTEVGGYSSFIEKDTPKCVVDYIAKTIFKGNLKESINKYYAKLQEDR